MHQLEPNGPPTLFEVRRVPEPPFVQGEPLRRPRTTSPRYTGTIPRQPLDRSLRPREVAVASTSGGRRSSAPFNMPEPRHTSPSPARPRGTNSARRIPPPPSAPSAGARQRSPQRDAPRRQPPPPAFHLETFRERYDKIVAARRRVDIVPHVGPKRIQSTGRYPIKMSGCRFGNMTPIPTHHELDPPPHTCFNFRRDTKRGNHRTMTCELPYIEHCENCGRRGVQVAECPRCSDAYFRDGYYLETDWGRAEARARARELPEVDWHGPPCGPDPPRPRVVEVVVPEVPIRVEPARRSIGTSPPHSPASPEPEIVAEIVHAAPLATALPPPVIEVAELAPPVPEPMEEGAVEPPADAMQPEPLAPAAAPVAAPAAAPTAPLPPLDFGVGNVCGIGPGHP